MDILDFFREMQLTSGQENALALLEGFLQSDQNIFMLKGYAGTGKTTLVKGIVKYLNACDVKYQIMAPTGRAAKILREKVGSGDTIHKTIYKLSDININVNNNHSDVVIHYPIEKLATRESVLIVDEASMISSKENKHPIYRFGSDILLKDLLTYASIHTHRTKIIFVGDPAQLPPVGDNQSWAFIPTLFIDKGFSVVSTELTQVVRQDDNAILKNAQEIRSKIMEKQPSVLNLTFDQHAYVHLSADQMVPQYVNNFPTPELENGVIISFSNMQCFQNNKSIRDVYYPQCNEVQIGDILQIVRNNYTYEIELFNGDFAQVVDVNNVQEKITAPVRIDEGGKMITKNISLSFVNITLLVNGYLFKAKLVSNLLDTHHPQLTIEEQKALYINFVMRFNEKQKKCKENGLPYAKQGSPEFYDALQTDPYLNAIQAKYGYAITCHKAQGGEWSKVFVDYTGRVSLKKDPLRWAYTATTRAVDTCFAINPPMFTKFRAFEITPIGRISNLPKNAISFENTRLSPYHLPHFHKCKSHKYWDVVEHLSEKYTIKNVISTEWQERYIITNGEDDYIVEGFHNSAGIFKKGFTLRGTTDEDVIKEILFAFEQTTMTGALSYNPSSQFFGEVFSLVQNAAIECDTPILNVVEQPAQNYVNYFFKTDALCAVLQFYFNKNNQLTKALPKTMASDNDAKFNQLIQTINNNVKH